MANFEPAYNLTLSNEGGYNNNPNDPGKETYKGISRFYWPDWEGWAIIDAKKSHPEFKQVLKEDEFLNRYVKAFYNEKFWREANLSDICSQEIANEIFDTGVNQGLERAVKYLQEALNLLNNFQKDYDDIGVDGVSGSETLHAYNMYMKTAENYKHRTEQINIRVMLKVLNGLQFQRYREITTDIPTWEEFFYGVILKRIS